MSESNAIPSEEKHAAPRYEITGTEPCQDCGGFNGLIWHSPQPLWDELMHRHGGLICPWCFTKRAEDEGIWITWTPMVARRNRIGNSNWWSNETRDWLLMGSDDPDYPDRSEHPVWAVVRDALEAAGYSQPPMDYYPPENFALPSRSNPDAGYHKMDRAAREKYNTPEEFAAYCKWAEENLA